MKLTLEDVKKEWQELPRWQRRLLQFGGFMAALMLLIKLSDYLGPERRPARCKDRICGHVCIVPYVLSSKERPLTCRISGFGKVEEPLEEVVHDGVCPAGAFYQTYFPYGNYRVQVQCGKYEGMLRFGVSSGGLNKHFVPVAETEKLPQ